MGGLWLRWVALAIFIAAGVSDFLDGYFARIWAQQSSLGRMLDPIADKLLVASCLLMLGAENTIHGWALFAAVVILCREILVSGLREYLAELRVSVPVTRLAKWKTTLQLIAVGFLICGEAGDAIVPVVTQIGIALLWLSALLTLYTGWDYLQAGRASPQPGGCVKLRYFAWVRERVGKAEEDDRSTRRHRDRRRTGGLAGAARRRLCLRIRESQSDPRRDRQEPCARRREDRRRRAKSRSFRR